MKKKGAVKVVINYPVDKEQLAEPNKIKIKGVLDRMYIGFYLKL